MWADTDVGVCDIKMFFSGVYSKPRSWLSTLCLIWLKNIFVVAKDYKTNKVISRVEGRYFFSYPADIFHVVLFGN